MNPVGRNVASMYPLPNRPGNFNNYISTRRSRDHRQRVLGPHRSPLSRQRLVLRPLQLRQVQAGRAAGAGGLLPADAGRGGGAVRPRAVRRRHPEHAADDARRRRSTTRRCSSRRSSTSCASATRGPCRSRSNRTSATLGAVARHPRHQRHRVHDRPAQHQHHGLHGHLGRPGVPAGEPEAVPLSDRGRAGVAEGAALAEVRLPAGRPVAVAVHATPTRAARSPSARSFVNNPVNNTGGTGLAACCSATSTPPRAAS